MTDKQEIFDRINELAQNMDLQYEFNDIDQIEEFLDNVENQQFQEYDEIESLYNELMELSFYDDSDQ